MKKYISLLLSLILLLSLVSSCMSPETITVTPEPITQTITETQFNTLTETKVVEKNTTLTNTTTITYNPYEKDYDTYDKLYLKKDSLKLDEYYIDCYTIDNCKYIQPKDNYLALLDLKKDNNTITDIKGINKCELAYYIGAVDNFIRIRDIKESQTYSNVWFCLDDVLRSFSYITLENNEIVVKETEVVDHEFDYCAYEEHTFENDGRYCDKCGWDRVWGNTLLIKDCEELFGKDPKYIADQIKTCGDLILYMRANRCGVVALHTPWFDGWTIDRTGYEELLGNYWSCCGGCANLAGYTLSDNYDEVGCIKFTGNNQNHMYNYIKIGNTYYDFDITPAYIRDDEMCSAEFDFLEDYATVIQQYKDDDCKGYDISDMNFIIAYPCTGTYLTGIPTKWDQDTIYIDKECKDLVTVIYKKNSTKNVVYQSLGNAKIPGWNIEHIETGYNQFFDGTVEFKNDGYRTITVIDLATNQDVVGIDSRTSYGKSTYSVYYEGEKITDYTLNYFSENNGIRTNNDGIIPQYGNVKKLSNGNIECTPINDYNTVICIEYKGLSVWFKVNKN